MSRALANAIGRAPRRSAPLAPRQHVSHTLIRSNAANELFFAVVGHVGSGTSEVATLLRNLLEATDLPGGPYDVSILKARDEILAWANARTHEPPTGPADTLAFTTRLQDLGDTMRHECSDHAAVARAFVQRIRLTRADKQHTPLSAEAVEPDGARRAYILDSLRHPAEVHILRQIYQSAFALVGVVCDEEKRQHRLVSKYRDAGTMSAQEFMARDAHAAIPHGQRVSDVVHLADYFIDNTADRYLDAMQPNPHWDVTEQLSRLIKLVTHSAIVRPTVDETAMYAAHGAGLRSACLSRQVGAALVDRRGRIVATGSNEVPNAGGGVYGDSNTTATRAFNDHRCAYRPLRTGLRPYCSNTVEQTLIIDELIERIPELSMAGDRMRIARLLRDSRIGELLEFSRAVHAEMDALLSAARSGVSPVGARLYVTTFPCHYCARHVVAAGVDQAQYIEPYPKSRALSLHSDSITMERNGWVAPSEGGDHVLFAPFTGVAPRLYPRAFAQDRELKDASTGALVIGEPSSGSPWYLSKRSYAQLEAALATRDAPL